MTSASATPAAAPAPSAVPRFTVVHDGSRLHYAIPVALQRAGMLDRVYTDWYSAPGSIPRLAARLLAAAGDPTGRRMIERYAPELDTAKVRSNPWLAMRTRTARRRFASDRVYHEWVSEQMAAWVLRRGFGDADALFGFVRNIHPTLLEQAKRRRMLTIADQMIAPAAIEAAEAAMQQDRFAGWEAEPDRRDLDRLLAYERCTWEATDRLTCASGYVRQGLIAQGIAADRVRVITYPIDTRRHAYVDRAARGRDEGTSRHRPVVVGFVGAVNLRKGAPYFFETAKAFDPARVRFVMVGPVRLDAAAVERHRGSVELVGPVPRSEIAGWLAGFDIFFFPSTCEGSAGAVTEAMASGLPVVTSPNAGSAVVDGREGAVRAYDDVPGFVSAIAALADDPANRLEQGRRARAAAEAADLSACSRAWVEMLAEVPACR